MIDKKEYTKPLTEVVKAVPLPIMQDFLTTSDDGRGPQTARGTSLFDDEDDDNTDAPRPTNRNLWE